MAHFEQINKASRISMIFKAVMPALPGPWAEDGFAQQIADLLGVDVMAPTELAWSEPDGTTYVASEGGVDIFGNPIPTDPPDGYWRLFSPNSDRESE